MSSGGPHPPRKMIEVGERPGGAPIGEHARAAGERSSCDVAIVGAGPYGLAAAARLRAVAGLETRVFGRPMSFWEGMPEGMLLRSAWDACHIGFASGEFTLDRYQAVSGEEFGRPVPLDSFVAYGRWFQRSAVGEVDPRNVVSLSRREHGYELVLEDSETVTAARVVVAAGIAPFARTPPEFRELPAELVSHSSAHRDLERFAERTVLVVGGGQSALESAALLSEAGAEVSVLARTPRIVWLHGGVIQRRLGRAKPLLYAQTDVGPAAISRVVASPGAFRRLPRSVQVRMADRAIRPAGAKWLVSRLAEIPLTTGRTVVRAAAVGAEVELTLDDGSARRADHVILGTGYVVDVGGYGFLAPDLLERIRRVDGYPLLGAGLESSVAGLHFLGAPAAWSFGPIMRFVSGSWFASRALARQIATPAAAYRT